MQAHVLEVHITFNKQMYGYDTAASLDPDQLKAVCEYNNALKLMTSSPASFCKNTSMTGIFGRSVALSNSMPKGTILTDDILVLKKPGTGIPPSCIHDLIGRKLSRDVDSRYLLQYNDIEEPCQ